LSSSKNDKMTERDGADLKKHDVSRLMSEGVPVGFALACHLSASTVDPVIDTVSCEKE
jgi:hypothetical protein